MEVTEHYGNFPPDWEKDELQALMNLVKREILEKDNKDLHLFYAKIYGKLAGMKHDYDW